MPHSVDGKGWVVPKSSILILIAETDKFHITRFCVLLHGFLFSGKHRKSINDTLQLCRMLTSLWLAANRHWRAARPPSRLQFL